MIYNRYAEKKSFKERIRKSLEKHPKTYDFLFQRLVVSPLLKKLEKRQYPCIVEIETINVCNNVCPFCPVSKGNDIREPAKMDYDLFNKIINELSEVKYSGVLGLYSNNEPLLDERIAEFAQTAREKLPYAHILLFTNGILLNETLFQKLIPFIDEMVIDNYNDELKMITPVQRVYDACIKGTEYENKTTIQLRKLNEVLTTRGGQAPNTVGKKVDAPKTTCLLLSAQCVIRPDGKVSLCCNDAYGKYSMGDLQTQTISEIWNGEKYTTFRQRMKKGRNMIGMCYVCDNRTMSVGYIKKGLAQSP